MKDCDPLEVNIKYAIIDDTETPQQDNLDQVYEDTEIYNETQRDDELDLNLDSIPMDG